MVPSNIGLLLGAFALLQTTQLYGAASQRSRHQHHSSSLRHRLAEDDDDDKHGTNSSEPWFGRDLPRNLTVQLGGTAYLPCQVNNLGNNSVSWIRNRDSHILTNGRETFIVDDRFSSLYNHKQSTWTLQIKYVKARDAGSYECQVSTVPKKMHFFNLAIVVPKVRIIGNREIHVQAGSQVQLKCVVSQAVQHPSYYRWYHNNEMVLSSNRLSPRFEAVTRDSSMSLFTISRAVKSDEGNYTCHPANLHKASVRLHVVNGELSEPSIQGGATRGCAAPRIFFLILLLLATQR